MKWFTRRRPAIPAAVRKNIESVVQLEQDLARRRSPADRVSDVVARFAGSPWSLAAHATWFAGWLLVNTGCVPGVPPFDPYPFSFLGMIVSLEVIFLTTFVLMSQNRQTRHEDHWAHVHLQVGLLAEQEATKMLQMLQRIYHHLGLEHEARRDPELKEMTQQTHVPSLVEELAKVRAVEAELERKVEKRREEQGPPAPPGDGNSTTR
jgi:uncharacterized membrane protein